MRRYPLLPITASFAAGIWAAPHFYLSAREQLLWVAGIFLLAALLALRHRFLQGFLVSLLGFFLCGTFLAAEEHAVLPQQHMERLARQGRFHPGEPLEVTGWARTNSVKRPGGEYFDLEVEELQQAGKVLPAKGVVRIYYFGGLQHDPPLDYAYGTRLSLFLRNLRRPRNFLTPGGYDYEATMRRQGIFFTGLVQYAAQAQVLAGRKGNGWRSATYHLQSRLLAYLDRRFPDRGDPVHRAAILKAILLGDGNWLDGETESHFQASGTYHVLVVSGLHVGALAFGLFWVFSWLRLPKGWSTLLIAVCVVTFAMVAGAGTPVMRATLMVLLYLVARLLYRERALLNSIAAAALLLLVLHPSDLREVSFQLSFLAVLVLAGIAVPVLQWTLSPYRQVLRDLEDQEKDKHLEPRLAQFRLDVRTVISYFCDSVRLRAEHGQFLRLALRKAASGCLALGEAVLFTFFMQLGFSLVMAVYFHRVAWSGVLANLIVLPLTGLLIPIGFVTLVASLLWWPLAAWLGGLLGLLVSLLRAVAAAGAERLAVLNPRVPPPPFWVSVAFLLLLLGLAVLVDRRSRWAWLPVCGLVFLGAFLTIAPYPPEQVAGRLEVTALDVGQGDSLLVNFPRGTTMLVDGGGAIPVPDAPPPRLDIGESVVSSFLWSQRLQRLDVVALTHAHWDHFGGLMTVLQNFHVGELWIGPGPPSQNLDRLLRLATERGVRIVRQQRGVRREMDGVEVLVLSPPPDWNPRRVSNNDSLVLRLGYRRRHVLLPGDVERPMENRMVENGFPIASDVLKVPHHGSQTSTTPAFLERVAPRFGIVSVGAYGRFGHPSPEVLEALQRAGVKTYRTDVDGATTVSTDGNRVELRTFRESHRPWPPFSAW